MSLMQTKAVLFIHGLAGKPKATWSAMEHLVRIDRDLAHCTVFHFTYPTSLIRMPFFSKSLRIQDLANGLRSEIENLYASYTDIVLVAHSLGGLVARHYLLDVMKDQRKSKVSGLILYATPNHGSGLAEAGRLFGWRHFHLRQMCRDSDLVNLLNRDWAALNPESRFRIKCVVGGQDRVVSLESASHTFGHNNVELVTDAGHINIVKPASHRNLAYMLLKNFLLYEQTIEHVESKSNIGSTSDDIVSDVRVVPAPLDYSTVSTILFFLYKPECEPYYVHRQDDDTLMRSLSNTNLWVSGPSGCGKTAAIIRWLTSTSQNYLYINLAVYSKASNEQIFQDIYSQICSRVSPSLKERIFTNLAQTLDAISELLSKDVTGMTYVFIEEIKTKDGQALKDFLSATYRLLVLHTSKPDVPKIGFIYSSIFSPREALQLGSSKLSERMDFIGFQTWPPLDIEKLATVISKSLGIMLSPTNMTSLVAMASGSPRYVKLFFRALINRHGDVASALEYATRETVQ